MAPPVYSTVSPHQRIPCHFCQNQKFKALASIGIGGCDFGNDIDSLCRAFSFDNQDHGAEANNAVDNNKLDSSTDCSRSRYHIFHRAFLRRLSRTYIHPFCAPSAWWHRRWIVLVRTVKDIQIRQTQTISRGRRP